MHHDEAPIHETGQQLLQTGRLALVSREGEAPAEPNLPKYGSAGASPSRPRWEYPHLGAVLSALGYGPWAVLPGPLGDTGADLGHGQTAGPLGPHCQPRYGGRPGLFLANCIDAVVRIENGYRLVVVNSHSTVYDGESWDCHADGGRLDTTLDDYRVMAPLFDLAFVGVIEQLRQRGLLDATLVVAAGEFGRTPFINSRGGRDHWPGVWTVLLAGAGVRGGAVIGASDKLGGEPADRPVTPAEFVATIYHALGVDSLPQMDAEPIFELFG